MSSAKAGAVNPPLAERLWVFQGWSGATVGQFKPSKAPLAEARLEKPASQGRNGTNAKCNEHVCFYIHNTSDLLLKNPFVRGTFVATGSGCLGALSRCRAFPTDGHAAWGRQVPGRRDASHEDGQPGHHVSGFPSPTRILSLSTCL